MGVKRTASTVLIRIADGIVSEVSARDVKTALLDRANAIPNCLPAVLDDISRLSNSEISRVRDAVPLMALRKTPSAALFEPASDTATEAFFHFQNGVVSVTAHAITLHPTAANNTKGYVWEQDIIPRDYQHNNKSSTTNKRFERFVEIAFRRKVRTGSQKWQDDFEMDAVAKQHYHAFRGCVGYLLHAYRDAANARAIIFVDADSDSTTAQGGTGKSVVAKSLAHLRSLASQDGKRFADSMNGSGRFQFSNVKADTRVVCIDDVRPEFKFEHLFTMLTGDMEVEQKGKDKLVIPSERVPKFVITTNYVLPQSGTSFQRRQYLVEFGGYWSNVAARDEQVSDSEHLGGTLFDGFNDEDWQEFYEYLFGCVQQYLKEGVVPAPSSPLRLKALCRELGDEFVDWCETFFETYASRKVSRDKGEYLEDLNNDFYGKYPAAPPHIAGTSFSTKIFRAAEFFGWEYNAHKAAMGSTPTARRMRIADAEGDKRDAVIFTKKPKK